MTQLSLLDSQFKFEDKLVNSYYRLEFSKVLTSYELYFEEIGLDRFLWVYSRMDLNPKELEIISKLSKFNDDLKLKIEELYTERFWMGSEEQLEKYISILNKFIDYTYNHGITNPTYLYYRGLSDIFKNIAIKLQNTINRIRSVIKLKNHNYLSKELLSTNELIENLENLNKILNCNQKSALENRFISAFYTLPIAKFDKFHIERDDQKIFLKSANFYHKFSVYLPFCDSSNKTENLNENNVNLPSFYCTKTKNN